MKAKIIEIYEKPGAYERFFGKGLYFFEAWGAQGGIYGGRGAYASGYLKLNTNRTLYMYVGQAGTRFTSTNPFNGGGIGQNCGGGASDVRLTKGNWSDTKSLISRIIVAGGGGGSDGNSLETLDFGGAGGGLVGLDSKYGNGKGGGQNAGGVGYVNGSFGTGGGWYNGMDSNGGGGGGYYGGGCSKIRHNYGGGGGSSFISGYPQCNAVSSSTSQIIHTNQNIHYSGLFFTNPRLIDGASPMPSLNGSTETGHQNNGAIKISAIKLFSVKYKKVSMKQIKCLGIAILILTQTLQKMI